MKRISLKDVASQAGISTSAVSFILNGRAEEMRISKDLEKRVQAIAARLGYVPNQVAVSLRTGQSKMIGLIVESISGHFFGMLAKIIEEEAEKAGYNLLYSSTENKAQRGVDVLKMFSQQQVDGYLITPAKGMEKAITAIAKHNKPLVLIDSYFPGDSISHVLVDNYKGMMMGMDHLFDKGYKDIGFVTVDLPLVQIEERKMAFTDALKNRKVKKISDHVLEIPYHSPGEDIIKRIKKFIHARPGMDAIFFATNYLGIHGLECIQREGLQMPADIAMICFDDHDLFRLFPKGITAIQQPIDEIAKKAISLLIRQLESARHNTQECEQMQIAPVLIKRGST